MRVNRVKRLVYIALLLLVALCAPLAHAFDSAWTHVATVTLDATYIDEAPPVVPVYLSGFDSTWHGAIQADADDIRVTEDDDTTEREYYLVAYDSGADTGLIIVNVDGYASASVDKDLRVWVGNSGASAGSDAAATFADYAGVYMPGMTVNDLTSGGRNLTAVNTPGTAASGFEGLTAATYNGSTQYHKYEGTQAVSDWPASIDALLLADVTTGSRNPVNISVWASSQNYILFSKAFTGALSGSAVGNGGSAAAASTITMSTATWYTVGVTRDSTTGDTFAYVGGTQYTNATNINTPTAFDRLGIGAVGISSAYTNFWDGNVAMVAISAEARTANYYATMYDAWNTSAFRTYGATASNGGATGHPWFYWRYRA